MALILSSKNRGFALVLTLALLVLVTMIVLAFFSKVKFDRKASRYFAAGSQVDEMGLGAIDTIIADLQEEIIHGSTNTAGIFRPRGVATIRPAQWVTSDEKTALPTLVRRSMRSSNAGSWQPANFGLNYGGASLNRLLASDVSTEKPARSGIFMPKESWNRPHLMEDTAFTSSFVSPDWIYWTRTGPEVNPSNFRSITGRFAFVIYDTSGLLNINVAGYPSSVSPEEVSGKGSIAYADLTRLPGLTPSVVNDFVVWRNQGSLVGQSFSKYLQKAKADVLVEPKSLDGFTVVGTGDERLLGRRDLVRYFEKLRSDGKIANLDALRFLTVSHPSLNSPSGRPLLNAPVSGFSYKDSAHTDEAVNRDFLSVKVKVPFTRMDGSRAVVGEPLVKRRFSLNRLAWLDSHLPTGGPAPSADPQKILKAFGLTWVANATTSDPGNSGNLYKRYWKYEPPGSNPSPIRIKTLAEVAQDGREPNFFELLKACILKGSLGGNYGTPNLTGPNAKTNASDVGFLDEDTDAHIFQIGANIIDQYDWGNYPTTLFAQTFPAADQATYGEYQYFTGVENLPYLSRIFGTLWLKDATPGNAADRMWEQWAWLQPEIWNPHQDQGSAGAHTGPTQFRVVASGAMHMSTLDGSAGAGTTESPTVTFDPNVGLLEFDLSGTNWREPTITTIYNATTTNPLGMLSQDTSTMSYVTAYKFSPNFLAGIVVAGTNPSTVVNMPLSALNPLSGFTADLPTTVSLQWRGASGEWNTYTQLRRMVYLSNNGSSAMGPAPFTYVIKTDPRTDRMGTARSYWNTPGTQLLNDCTRPNETMRKNAGQGTRVRDRTPPRLPFVYTTASSILLGLISENKSSLSVYYKDTDGVVRRADGAYAGSGLEGMPMATRNNPSRPIVLNSPFRNVAEMGLTFRDIPWKHLDFFTEESADAALMDVFSVTDADVVEDRINISSAPQPVLEALLSGVAMDPASSSSLTKSVVPAVAAAVKSTLTNPMESPAEIVTKVTSAKAMTDALTPATLSSIKNQRESVSRALAPVVDTRTWNLMLDVVVQSGIMASESSRLADFMPFASRRYWVHVSIDRFTNQLLEIRTEPIHD